MLNLHSRLNDVVHAWKERLSCNAPDCHGRRLWGRISDGAGSAQLHGRRYCFPACFEQELRRRFSEVRVPASRRSRPPHRVPLGLLMLSRGELSHEQLRRALEAQRQSGSGRIGEWIQKLGYVHEQQVTAALGAQWSCPVLRTLPANVAECKVPFQLLRRFRMAPVHYSRPTGVLHIAFAADIEYRALLAIEEILECKAEPCLADATALYTLLARMEEHGRGTDQAFEGVRGPEEMTRITSSYAAKLGADDMRLVGCAEYFWVRIEGRKDSANLLFTQTNTEVFAQSFPANRRPSRPILLESA
jgi:hypothetical protein